LWTAWPKLKRARVACFALSAGSSSSHDRQRPCCTREATGLQSRRRSATGLSATRRACGHGPGSALPPPGPLPAALLPCDGRRTVSGSQGAAMGDWKDLGSNHWRRDDETYGVVFRPVLVEWTDTGEKAEGKANQNIDASSRGIPADTALYQAHQSLHGEPQEWCSRGATPLPAAMPAARRGRQGRSTLKRLSPVGRVVDLIRPSSDPSRDKAPAKYPRAGAVCVGTPDWGRPASRLALG